MNYELILRTTSMHCLETAFDDAIGVLLQGFV